MAKNKLEIEIDVQGAKSAVTDLNSASKATDNLGTSSAEASKQSSGLSATLIKAGPIIGAVVAVFVALGTAIKGVVASIKDFDKSQKSINEMNIALAKNVQLTKSEITSLQGLGQALQGTTTASDEMVNALVQIGANVKLPADEIERLTQLSIDFAVATGKGMEEATQTMIDLSTGVNDVATVMQLLDQTGNSLEQSQRDLVMQLEAEATELANLGDALGASEKQALAFNIAVEALNQTVGGAGARELDTVQGKWTALGNTFQDMSVEVGRLSTAFFDVGGVMDFVQSAVDKAFAIIKDPAVEEALKNIQVAFKVVGAYANQLFTNFIKPAFENIVSYVTLPIKAIENIISAFSDMGEDGTQDLESLVYPLKVIAGGFINLYDILKNASLAVSGFFDALFTGDWDTFGQEISQIGDNMSDAFGNFLSADALAGKTDDVISIVKGMRDEIDREWAQALDSPDIDPIKSTFDELVAEGKKALNAVASTATDIVQEVTITAEELANEAKLAFIKALGEITSVATSFGSLVGNIFDGISSSMTIQDVDTRAFDNAIDNATQKQLDALAKIDEATQINQKTDSIRAQQKAKLLDEELSLAIARGDKVTENAIANELKIIEAEKNAVSETEKLADKREQIEKETSLAIAKAEYQKDLAIYNNKLASAQQNKEFANAEAAISISLASGLGAWGVARAFAEGGLVGLAAGLGAVAGVVGAVVGASQGIQSASNAYDAVKSSPPVAPSFAYGTSGYNLGIGSSAIVGERGAEVVTNTGAGIQVQSTANTPQAGLSQRIENVIIQVTELVTPEQVQEMIANFDSRSLSYNVS